MAGLKAGGGEQGRKGGDPPPGFQFSVVKEKGRKRKKNGQISRAAYRGTSVVVARTGL